jgi:hypothetical protein
MQPSYEGFVWGFEAINPFQLMHFAETVQLQLEEILADRELEEKLQFSLQDLKYAITGSMRTLLVEMAEQHMAEAKQRLQRTKLHTYATLPNMAAAE